MFDSSSTFTRGRLVSLDDTGEHQRMVVEGYAGERFSNVVRAQSHGFSSSPPAGAVGHFMRMGESDRVFALGYETPQRPLNTIGGGAVLYDGTGNIVYAKMGGGVEVKANAGTVTLTRGSLSVTISQTRVDLGGPGGTAVLTQAGPSTKVFAIL